MSSVKRQWNRDVYACVVEFFFNEYPILLDTISAFCRWTSRMLRWKFSLHHYLNVQYVTRNIDPKVPLKTFNETHGSEKCLCVSFMW